DDVQLGDERVRLTADWPISIDEVFAASERLRAHLVPPLRGYAPLDEAAGGGIRVLVEHENHQPTNAFKVRNPLSALTLLDGVQRRRGALGATRQPRAGGLGRRAARGAGDDLRAGRKQPGEEPGDGRLRRSWSSVGTTTSRL